MIRRPPRSPLFPYTPLSRSEHDGRYFQLRYVNLWPRPQQVPHPPVWIPGASSLETMDEVARRGYTFFLSTRDRKSTRLNSSHANISYAVFCLKKKKETKVIY